MKTSANSQLEARLDNNRYDISELISIKVPAAGKLPYANSLSDFQRVNGQIEMQGIQYNYVKWRLYNDTLEFLCVPNPIVAKLQTAKIDFFKLVNDLQNSGQNKKSDPSSNMSKNFSSEYYVINEFSGFGDLYFTISKKSTHLSVSIPHNFSSSIDYPPEYNC